MKQAPLWLVVAALSIAGCSSDDPLSGRAATAPAVLPSSPPALSNEIILSIRPGTDPAEIWTEYGLWPRDVLPDGRTFRAGSTGSETGPIMTRIQADERIVAAELNLPVIGPILRQSSVAFNEGFPTNGTFFEHTLAQRLKLAAAHAGSRGYGVKIAVLDTGIDMDHPILAPRILPGSRDFLDIDYDPSDRPDGIDNDGDGYVDEATGHGSHVAGLVVLVAPSARIMALRVLNSDGIGNVYGVAAAIEYAVSRGVRVINLSIGLTAPSPVIDQAIAFAVEHGVILVTAAGNTPGVTSAFPSEDPRVWSVAAVDAADRPAPFTSSFPAVVLSAPGVNLQSTYWDGSFAVWSGTSMAAPLVAGTAALVIANNPLLRPAEVLNRLQSTAKPFPTSVSGMGAGIVNPGGVAGGPQVDVLPSLELAR